MYSDAMSYSADLSQVIRKKAIKEGVFLKSLQRMHENHLSDQIKQAIRVLGRLAGSSLLISFDAAMLFEIARALLLIHFRGL